MSNSTEWIGGSITLPSYVTGEGDAPFRPETFIWAEPGGRVIHASVFRAEEAADRVGASFREAARAKAAGKRPPSRVRVASPEHAEILRREIGATTEVVCAPTPELDAVLASLLEHMAEDHGGTPTYVTAGLTEDAIARLFRAAARLYRAQPWRAVPSDARLLSVDIPELDVEGARLSIIGQMNSSFGVLVFRDEATFERYVEVARPVASGEVAARELPPHVTLSFEARAAIGPELAAEVSEHRWEIAGPSAYPALAAVDDEGIARPPTARELAMLEAIAHALAELVEATPRLHAMLEDGEVVEKEVAVDTSCGPAVVTLSNDAWRNPYADRPFDIHEDLFEDGEMDEERAYAFEEELVRLFGASEEGVAIGAKGNWARRLLEHARMYHGVPVTELSPALVEDVVFLDIPRQVSCEADVAPAIVAELRAFLAFLGRAFGLDEVAKCASVLGQDATMKLRKRLSDPRYFGMAKSFFMSGRAAGFDMTTEQGAAAWMAEANARLGGGFVPGTASARETRKVDPSKKKKRKAERAGRRKNRR